MQVLLEFRAPAKALSMNDGDNPGTWAQVEAWRDRAYWAWIEQFPGVGPSGRALYPAEVHTIIGFRTATRRDPINYARTVKHIVDGLQLAGAWPDDTLEYVTQHIPTLRKDTDEMVLVRVSSRLAPLPVLPVL